VSLTQDVVLDELRKLVAERDSGALSAQDFERQAAELLAQQTAAPRPGPVSYSAAPGPVPDAQPVAGAKAHGEESAAVVAEVEARPPAAPSAGTKGASSSSAWSAAPDPEANGSGSWSAGPDPTATVGAAAQRKSGLATKKASQWSAAPEPGPSGNGAMPEAADSIQRAPKRRSAAMSPSATATWSVAPDGSTPPDQLEAVAEKGTTERARRRRLIRRGKHSSAKPPVPGKPRRRIAGADSATGAEETAQVGTSVSTPSDPWSAAPEPTIALSPVSLSSPVVEVEVEADPTGEIPAVASAAEVNEPSTRQPQLDPVPASPELIAAAAAAAPSADLLAPRSDGGNGPVAIGRLDPVHLRYWDLEDRERPRPPVDAIDVEDERDGLGRESLHYWDFSERRWPKQPKIVDEEESRISRGGYWDKGTIRR